jgi:hypothetical protein
VLISGAGRVLSSLSDQHIDMPVKGREVLA